MRHQTHQKCISPGSYNITGTAVSAVRGTGNTGGCSPCTGNTGGCGAGAGASDVFYNIR